MFEKIKLEPDDKPEWVCLKCGQIHYVEWKKDKSGGYWHSKKKCDCCGKKR